MGEVEKDTLEMNGFDLYTAARYPDELFAVMIPELVGDMNDCKSVTAGVAVAEGK